MSDKEIKTEEKNENTVKPYELRRLKNGDLFPLLDVVSKVLPDDLSEVFFQLVSKEKSIEEIGGIAVYRIVVAVLKNTGKVRNELNALLSDLSGIPADEIDDLPFGTTPMMIWDIVSDAKNADFFSVLSKSL